jgi:hypothetical protein
MPKTKMALHRKGIWGHRGTAEETRSSELKNRFRVQRFRVQRFRVQRFRGSGFRGSGFKGLGLRAPRCDPTGMVQGSAPPLAAAVASLIENETLPGASFIPRVK